jgi:geranylgeranyl diphosphate synthase type I
MSVESDRRVQPADLDQVFEQVQGAVVPRLRATVDRLPASMRDVVGYHFGWCDELGRPANGRSGKLIRPALTLLSARAVGAGDDLAVDAAVAVELVHNFSMLHDDVMDGALTRRSRETVWWQFGMPVAILAGDALLPLAIELLAPVPGSVYTLCEAVRELVHGQSLDISFEQRDDVTPEECLAMSGGKTATLLRCACELGAVHGGGAPARVLALKTFGWHLGIAFQLVDDLLGIWGDPRLTGKPALADLRAGKKTAPVVAALAAGGPVSRRLAQLYLRPDPLDEHELATVAALVAEAGGRAWARSEAGRQIRAALACLRAASPEPEVQEALVDLAYLVTARDH